MKADDMYTTVNGRYYREIQISWFWLKKQEKRLVINFPFLLSIASKHCYKRESHQYGHALHLVFLQKYPWIYCHTMKLGWPFTPIWCDVKGQFYTNCFRQDPISIDFATCAAIAIRSGRDHSIGDQATLHSGQIFALIWSNDLRDNR